MDISYYSHLLVSSFEKLLLREKLNGTIPLGDPNNLLKTVDQEDLRFIDPKKPLRSLTWQVLIHNKIYGS